MKTTIQTLLVLLSFALFSCQDFESLESATDLTASQLKSAEIAVNDVAVESVAEEVTYESDFYSEYENILRKLAKVKGLKHNLLSPKYHGHYAEGYEPSVSIDTALAGYPIVITIEYGDSTITQSGRVMSGTVTIEISADKHTYGATRTITYTNCSIDSIGIEGVTTEVFIGDDITTRKMTTSSDVTFTLADGTVIDRVGNHVREWTGGLETDSIRSDDQIQVTGSVEITSSTGDVYSKLITEPLIRIGDCRHYVQGIVEFSQNGAVISTLNYGDGECDNIANLTTDGTTVEIELKGKMPKADTEGHRGKGKLHGKGR